MEIGDILEKIVNGVLTFLYIFIWKPISFIFGLLKKFITDLAKGVYGRIIQWLSWLIVGALISYLYYSLK